MHCQQHLCLWPNPVAWHCMQQSSSWCRGGGWQRIACVGLNVWLRGIDQGGGDVGTCMLEGPRQVHSQTHATSRYRHAGGMHVNPCEMLHQSPNNIVSPSLHICKDGCVCVSRPLAHTPNVLPQVPLSWLSSSRTLAPPCHMRRWLTCS
mgnify:CR=1 FL=1